MPEMRERQAHSTAFRLCGAIERKIFRWFFHLGVLQRFLRVHASILRLPLTAGE